MSYSYNLRGLGLAEGDTYPSGTQVVGGFQVVGLPSSRANEAKRLLRDAVAASFTMGTAAPAASGTRDSINWGPAYGVPSGRLYALVTTDRDGVTGAAINTAFIAAARDLRTRLGGLVVNLTNSHTRGGAAPLPALTPDTGPDGSPAPVDPGGSGGSLSPLAIGGVVFGVAALAVIAFAFTRRPVARNTRRRRR
jgi:hypothetical protein